MSFTNKKISQIRPMKTRDPEVDRVNIHIYDKLNEIIGIVNTPEKKIPKEETEGKVGTLETKKVFNGFQLRIKTDDGWFAIDPEKVVSGNAETVQTGLRKLQRSED